MPSVNDVSLQTKAEAITVFYNVIIHALDELKMWAEMKAGFADLCKEDWELLFQSAVLELFVLRIAYR